MLLKFQETKDYSYALELAIKKEKENKNYLEKSVKENLYRLWEVYLNDKKIGVVLSMFIDGIYTLDGYNETKDFNSALKAGKFACNEIFKVTDTIWTIHLKTMTKVTLLAKKIGFKIQKYEDGYVFLKKEKSWV